MSKETLLQWMTANETKFTAMAQKIWEHPEVAYEENYASKLQKVKLKEEGFSIQSSIGSIPTAFVAEYGSGKPIIGILGEFDALPGLSQTVNIVQEQAVSNGPGHGCGHNLLGTAGVEAVIALKKVMNDHHLNGTIRYYGCPAEEVLSGKTYMAKEGVFDDLDCALTWHPWTSNFVLHKSMQSAVSIKYHFKGTPTHAAASPHAGRSALDAVELMNVGSNYLREHIVDGARIHYVTTNGGLSPNIVPEHASVWYYLRAATKEQVDDMLRRVEKIAQGAALMTETEVRSEIEAFPYNTLPNDPLNEIMFDNMKCANSLHFTNEEKKWAEALVKTIDPAIVKAANETEKELLSSSYQNDTSTKGKSMSGSTDVGDVSWITPTATVMTTCAPTGVQLHTWQATASFGSSIGFKGMHLAAQTMALSAYDLLINKDDVLNKAKEEFKIRTEGKPYTAGIPAKFKQAAEFR
ncbi:amidohydrolase [Bacillus taeanensis]|uniref:Amidohydrolase n=1 Tax=Bacillus taeanensis TaxID=273032 RepID=A0A366XRB6_9BACI|nr:amidohydrolase [Bacillus taeanensis]RBW68437.1 amidohydrolase [Bacillus taeanensis]